MAENIVVYDDTTGTKKNSGVTIASLGGSSAPSLEFFTVGGGGQSVFSLAADISADQRIDTTIDGIEKWEGASRDWERDAGADQITFTYTVPEGTLVVFKIF